MTPALFEDRLLAELHHVVATRPASTFVAAPRRRREPRLLIGGAATAAVAAAAILVSAGGNVVTPAFAIERQSDGTVTVTINRLSDAAGLERQLRAAGISAVVNYTPLGKACHEPRGRPAPPSQRPAGDTVSGSSVVGRSTTFTVSRTMVGSGQTLVITTSGGRYASSVGVEVIQGPVSPCQLVDAPAPPAAPARGLSTDGPSRRTSTGAGTRSLHAGP